MHLLKERNYVYNCIVHKRKYTSFFLIRTNLIRKPTLRFAIGRRAKSKTNDRYRKWNVKNDRASSKMHFKGIIWGGVGRNLRYGSEKIKTIEAQLDFTGSY